MSNRAIWFFIIVFSSCLIAAFYWYAFVFNVSSISLSSNVWDFDVRLDSQQHAIEHYCEEEICKIENIASFDFSLIASKTGYNTIEKQLDLSRGGNTIEIIFQKDYTPIKIDAQLSKNDEKILEKLADPQKIIEEKREELKKSQNLYFLVKTKDNTYYFYDKDQNQEVLNIWKNDQNLWNIPRISKQNLDIKEVLWNQNEFFIKSDSKYLLFHTLKKNYIPVDFSIDIDYVKKTLNNNYIIVSQKGSFIWDIKDNSFEYNHLFDDYIEYQNGYVWYIKAENTYLKKKIFNELPTSQWFFYFYSPQNKEKQILFSSDIDFDQIYYQDTKIILKNKQGELFEIPHLSQ